MNLLFIIWGNSIHNHIQCSFALLTAMRYRDCFDSFFVMTDRPEYYQFFDGKIEIIPITPNQISDWVGPWKYMFNIKIKGIEYFHTLYPDKPVLFSDSDVVFTEDPSPLKEILEQGIPIMHAKSDSFEQNMKRSQTARRVFPLLKKIESDAFKITKDTYMHNSGIIGLPAKDMDKNVAEVYDLSETLCSHQLRVHYLEQLAFTLVLLKNYREIRSSTDIVRHYWGNKPEWNKLISDFFSSQCLKGASVDDMIDSVSSVDFNLPVVRKERHANLKLKLLVDKAFPPRIEYLAL